MAAQSYTGGDDLTQGTCALPDIGIQSDTTPCLISCLHPEILQLIFIHCACDHYTDSNQHGETDAPPSWVNVSYVCRYWRNVALTCPALWSYPFITSRRWTVELLARSKQAPLMIQVNLLSVEFEQASCFVEQAVDHLERIQELYLRLYNSSWEDHFYPLLRARAPRLRHLRIALCGGPDPKQLPVPFEGDTPALRTLELSRCSMPFGALKLSGLTTLGLYDVPGQLQKSVAELLTTLRCMQTLENLYLRGALSSNASFHASVKQVYLPHLSRLLVAAPLSAVVAFLTNVHFASKTELRLDCRCEDDFSMHVCASLFAILGHHQAPSRPTWRSIIIENPESGMTVTFSALEHDLLPLRPLYLQWSCVQIKVRLSWLASHVVGDLLSVVPLPDVHMLQVITSPYAPEFWRAVLGKLPGVRAIRLVLGDLPDLASVLAHDHGHAQNQYPGQDCGGHTDRMLAPNLEALDFHRVRFSVRQLRWPDTWMGNLASLCAVLAARHGGPGRLVVNSRYEEVDAASGVRQLDVVGEWSVGRVRVRRVDRPRGLRM